MAHADDTAIKEIAAAGIKYLNILFLLGLKSLLGQPPAICIVPCSCDAKRRSPASLPSICEREERLRERGVVEHTTQTENHMRVLLGALVACTIAMPAMAQQPAAQSPSMQAAPVPASGQWRASKLMGVNVYNEQNEKLGEINELIIDRSGQIAGAIIGVGGFLGIGEHAILVPMDRLKFSNEAGRSTTGAASANNKQWYPDRAVMNATKDQIKAMPQFTY